jgi:hypothetical protein
MLQGSRRKVSSGTPAVPHPTAADIELDRLSEAELWQRVVRLMEAAKQKQGMLAEQDKNNMRGVSCRSLCKHKLADECGYSMWAFPTVMRSCLCET